MASLPVGAGEPSGDRRGDAHARFALQVGLMLILIGEIRRWERVPAMTDTTLLAVPGGRRRGADLAGLGPGADVAGPALCSMAAHPGGVRRAAYPSSELERKSASLFQRATTSLSESGHGLLLLFPARRDPRPARPQPWGTPVVTAEMEFDRPGGESDPRGGPAPRPPSRLAPPASPAAARPGLPPLGGPSLGGVVRPAPLQDPRVPAGCHDTC